MTESGCAMEHPAASKFRGHVLDGDWERVRGDSGHLRNFFFDWIRFCSLLLL